jgi:hypothetical protein
MKGGTVQGQVGVDVCPQPATSTSRNTTQVGGCAEQGVRWSPR